VNSIICMGLDCEIDDLIIVKIIIIIIIIIMKKRANLTNKNNIFDS